MPDPFLSPQSKEVLPVAEAWAEELGEGYPTHKVFPVIENLPEHLTKHATLILKALYDKDVLSEEAILAWHSEADEENAAVKATQAFVDFLKED